MSEPLMVPTVREAELLALTALRLRAKSGELPPAAKLHANDPVEWIERRLGDTLWSKQREIARAVPVHRHVAVKSAHSMGKSFLVARLIAWWIDSHAPGEAFAVSTAPSFNQVRAILWRELNRAHRAGNLPGRVNQTEWWFNGELVAMGRKPADYDPTSFQGIHAAAVLVVLDEADGIPETIFEAAESLATNEDCRIVAIGNPVDPSSHFCSRVLKPGSGWNVIHVDGLASPNFTGEKVPPKLRKLLLSPLWVDERRAEWGEESPSFVSKVRGEVPEDVTDGTVPLSFIRRCMDPGGEGLAVYREAPEEPVELGFDVGAGGDPSVIRERRGPRLGRVWRTQTPDPMQLCGEAVRVINETGATRVKIDVIGVGWGVAGRLAEMREEGKHGAEILPVNVAEAASQPNRFPRLRDEMWWEVGRELSRTGGWDLTGLDDTTIVQLVAPKYRTDSAGRTVVESKDDVRKRIGRSTDDADALLLAFYQPPERTGGWSQFVRRQVGGDAAEEQPS